MHGQSSTSALARYNPDGSLDPTFGAGGPLTTDFGGDDPALPWPCSPTARSSSPGVCCPCPSNVDFALARYNPDGTLDPPLAAAER